MGVNRPRFQISIESLSLVGFSQRDADRFESAFRHELTSLLTSATGVAFASGTSDHLSGNVAKGSAESMGRTVAHTVFRGLPNG
ncbi:MAG: hypothetical protein P4L46_23995 [Fimbriimonas sp.]|nr:hypothetical protein [Fimbriimonas sp.]